MLRLGSVNTVKNYVEYLENSWLALTVNVYDYSVKRQQIAPKKTYAIDTGLVNAIGFSFSPNTGRLLENLVFLALRRKTKEIYYVTTPSGYQVDFFLPQSQQLIQVAQNMHQPETRAREVRALQEAMQMLNIPTGLILSEAEQETIAADGKTIEMRSIAEWLLEK